MPPSLRIGRRPSPPSPKSPGGHTHKCRGLGDLPVDDCRRALVVLRPSGCSALSYKDGQCYLHDVRGAGFYTDVSPGHQIQMAL